MSHSYFEFQDTQPNIFSGENSISYISHPYLRFQNIHTAEGFFGVSNFSCGLSRIQTADWTVCPGRWEKLSQNSASYSHQLLSQTLSLWLCSTTAIETLKDTHTSFLNNLSFWWSHLTLWLVGHVYLSSHFPPSLISHKGLPLTLSRMYFIVHNAAGFKNCSMDSNLGLLHHYRHWQRPAQEFLTDDLHLWNFAAAIIKKVQLLFQKFNNTSDLAYP